MNREIKFRGKRIDTDEWVYGSLRTDPDLKYTEIDGYEYYTDEDGLQREPFGYPVDPDTVGQYTGYKDKNDKEIYEGDVVTCYGGEYYMGCWRYKNTILVTSILTLTEYEHTEVLGNIIDDSKLRRYIHHDFNG